MKNFVFLLSMFCLTSCASADFERPRFGHYKEEHKQDGKPKAKIGEDDGNWERLDVTKVSHVEQYLRYSDATVVGLISQGEATKYLTELPIIGAGIFVPTSLALGKSNNRAIYGSAVAGAGGLLTSYLSPRERAKTAAEAEVAISCISTAFNDQMTQAASLGSVTMDDDVTTTDISNGVAALFPDLAAEVSGAGRRAIDSTNMIFSRLRLNLLNMGSAPDYAAIIKDMQQKMQVSEGMTSAKVGLPTTPSAAQTAIAKHLSEYPIRLAECVAKYP